LLYFLLPFSCCSCAGARELFIVHKNAGSFALLLLFFCCPCAVVLLFLCRCS
jgi:hypothetical protein